MTIIMDTVREDGEVTLLGTNERVKRALAKTAEEDWTRFHANDPFVGELPCWAREAGEFLGLLEALCQEM